MRFSRCVNSFFLKGADYSDVTRPAQDIEKIPISEGNIKTALGETVASYKLNGEALVAKDRRDLIYALFKLGWLGGNTFERSYKNGSNSYNFTLDYDKINIVGFSREYAEKHTQDFLKDVENMEDGKVAAIIVNSDFEKQQLENNQDIQKRLGRKIFIVNIKRWSYSSKQWTALLGEKTSYDFSQIRTVKDIFKNRDLIKAIARAK